MNKGVISVLVAYLIWGLYPFYFHAMQHVAPAEIVIHRVLWTSRFQYQNDKAEALSPRQI